MNFERPENAEEILKKNLKEAKITEHDISLR